MSVFGLFISAGLLIVSTPLCADNTQQKDYPEEIICERYILDAYTLVTKEVQPIVKLNEKEPGSAQFDESSDQKLEQYTEGFRECALRMLNDGGENEEINGGYFLDAYTYTSTLVFDLKYVILTQRELSVSVYLDTGRLQKSIARALAHYEKAIKRQHEQ